MKLKPYIAFELGATLIVVAFFVPPGLLTLGLVILGGGLLWMAYELHQNSKFEPDNDAKSPPA